MTYVGQNYGAGKMDRIRAGTKSGMILSLSCSVIISIIMLIGAQGIFFAEVSAWTGANLILVPTFLVLFRKTGKLKKE